MLASIVPGLGTGALNVLRSPDRVPIEAVMTAFANDLEALGTRLHFHELFVTMSGCSFSGDTASAKPRQTSETTNSTPERPRSLRCARKALQPAIHRSCAAPLAPRPRLTLNAPTHNLGEMILNALVVNSDDV